MNDDFDDKLSKRLTIPDGNIITYDEIMQWPAGKLDELIERGKVRKTSISETVECVECPQKCPIIPDIRKHPETHELFGVYVCPYEQDIGWFTVDLNRRRRWEIVPDKFKSAFFKPVESQPEIECRKKNRPTKKEMADRNRSVALVAVEFESKHGRLPTVDEIIKKTSYNQKQIYQTDAYKEGKIAKNSAKVTDEMTGASITPSEYFGERSIQHTRAKNRSKSDQAALDALIEEQANDSNSSYIK